MKVDYIEETPVRKALSFEIEPEVVEQEIESRAREYARKVKLPGFRPGKVPADVIKKRFRSQVIEDVVETIANRVVRKELDDRGLKPVDNPRLTDLKIAENEPMSFKAVFETLPLVELPEYKGLSVRARRPNVTEQDVDREVERLREEAARYDPVEDRPLREGDHALLDLTWQARDGGKAGRDETALIEVGSADNHPTFNAALVGMAAGETRPVSVAYEESHPSKALAGRTVDYTVTLKAIKTKVLPDVDDEFAKDLGEFGTLAELRADIHRRLEAADEHRIDREVKEALVDALVAASSFEVPESLVERQMMARTEGAARSLAYQGIDPRNAGVDWQKYREGQREQSVKGVKADILLDEIARREHIEVPDPELDAELGRIADRMKKPKDAVRRAMDKEGELMALRSRLREEKTLDLLKANARLEVEP